MRKHMDCTASPRLCPARFYILDLSIYLSIYVLSVYLSPLRPRPSNSQSGPRSASQPARPRPTAPHSMSVQASKVRIVLRGVKPPARVQSRVGRKRSCTTPTPVGLRALAPARVCNQWAGVFGLVAHLQSSSVANGSSSAASSLGRSRTIGRFAGRTHPTGAC